MIEEFVFPTSSEYRKSREEIVGAVESSHGFSELPLIKKIAISAIALKIPALIFYPEYSGHMWGDIVAEAEAIASTLSGNRANYSGRSVEDVLPERKRQYGPFSGVATISISIKSAYRNNDQWWNLSAEKMEALDMIASKLARIINGDSDHHDSWIDIAGYAALIKN